MKARTQVEEAMDGVGAEPLRPGCRAWGGWAQGVGDETLWVTRWVPRSELRDLDAQVISVGKLLASDVAGVVGDTPEDSVARLAALRQKLKARQESRTPDAFELRNLRGEIEDMAPKAAAVQSTLDKELTHVLLIFPERLRKASVPTLRTFTVKPTHAVITRPQLGAEQIRRSMRWSKKMDSADSARPRLPPALRSALSSTDAETRLGGVRQLSSMVREWVRIGPPEGDIGVRIRRHGPDFVAESLVPGLPAARGGVQEGDYLMSVDGVPTSGMPPERLTASLRGPVGQAVRITITRPAQAGPIEMTLVRDSLSEEQREVVTLLIGSIQDADPSLRTEALSSLGQLGRQAFAAVPSIIKALEDDDASVRAAAKAALAAIDTVEARKALQRRR